MIVWLASYPRSGNTLTRLLFNQGLGLRTYSQYNDRNVIGSNPEVAATVGHLAYEGDWDDFYRQARESGELRLVKTHDVPRDDARAIYILRDGRSSVVSYFHYLKNFGRRDISLGEVIAGLVPFGSWSNHVNAWRPRERPNTLFLRYEDIVADKQKAIGEIARFLGVEAGQAQVSGFSDLHAKQPNFFRSGSNERNIGELDSSHMTLFRLAHGHTMAAYGYDCGEPPTDLQDMLPALEALRADLKATAPRVDDAALAALVEEQRERALRAELQSTELGEVCRQQEAEMEDRQQRVAQLEERLSALQRQVAGNPVALLRARRGARRMLAEDLAKPGPPAAAVASASGPAQQALWTSLVPDRYRTIPPQDTGGESDRDFGIAVFGFNRPDLMESVLTSLGHQKMLGGVHVFIDGDQGRPHARAIIDEVANVAGRFPVRAIHRRRGNLGFRKMMLQAMTFMSEHYDRMLFLEDDCFPTRDCCRLFRAELDLIAGREDVFSVYGHPFGVPNETDYFTRFQGWGWGTTSARLKPVLADLIRCYWMDEADFVDFAREAMTEDVLQRIDVTPGRQPSVTLRRFFAWDETMCLLTALRNMTHKRTASRVVYNCGAGSAGSHFTKVEYYRKPPFNMIAADEVWNYF